MRAPPARPATTTGGRSRWWLLTPLLAAFMLAAPALALRTGLTPVAGTPAAPALSLTSLDGRLTRLEDLRGKVVVVNFWATWCAPCREEMPTLQKTWQDLRGPDFELLAINVGEEEAVVREFLAAFEAELEFPILLDPGSQTVADWKLKGLPVTVVIDKHGRAVYEAVGGRDMASQEIIEILRALMGE